MITLDDIDRLTCGGLGGSMSNVQFVARIAPRRYFIFGATSPLGKYLPIDLMWVFPHRMLHAAYRNSHEVAEGPEALIGAGSNASRMAIGCRPILEDGDETAGLGTAVAWPLVTRASQGNRVRRISVLNIA
jgi:hypothetical protein